MILDINVKEMVILGVPFEDRKFLQVFGTL